MAFFRCHYCGFVYTGAELRSGKCPTCFDQIPKPLETVKKPRATVRGACHYCGDPAITWDHVIPRSRGGSNRVENKVPACRRCNSEKGDSYLEDWKEDRIAAGLSWPPERSRNWQNEARVLVEFRRQQRRALRQEVRTGRIWKNPEEMRREGAGIGPQVRRQRLERERVQQARPEQGANMTTIDADAPIPTQPPADPATFWVQIATYVSATELGEPDPWISHAGENVYEVTQVEKDDSWVNLYRGADQVATFPARLVFRIERVAGPQGNWSAYTEHCGLHVPHVPHLCPGTGEDRRELPLNQPS